MNRRKFSVGCSLLGLGVISLLAFKIEKGLSGSSPIISLNRLDALKFSVVVANCSANDIRLGSMNSIIGMDQFTFEIKTDHDPIVLTHRLGFITVDPRRPLLIPAGGHHEFIVNLGDGDWYRESTQKNVSLASWKTHWKAVRVVYKRSKTDFQDHKTNYGLLTGKLQSRWIDPQFPRRRFINEWAEKLSRQINGAKGGQ